MNHFDLRVTACALTLLLTPQLALAAEWRPLSLTVTPAGASTSAQSFTYGTSNFLDNVYPPQFLLSNTPIAPPTTVGQSRVTIGFAAWMESFGGLSPYVDTAAQTINLSSIWAEGWQAQNVETSCVMTKSGCMPVYELTWVGMIGGDFGPLAPVSYSVNPDGTYTAIWNPVHSRSSGFDMFALTDQLAFTFATAVPESDQSLLFAVGIATLLAFKRRRV